VVPLDRPGSAPIRHQRLKIRAATKRRQYRRQYNYKRLPPSPQAVALCHPRDACNWSSAQSGSQFKAASAGGRCGLDGSSLQLNAASGPVFASPWCAGVVAAKRAYLLKPLQSPPELHSGSLKAVQRLHESGRLVQYGRSPQLVEARTLRLSLVQVPQRGFGRCQKRRRKSLHLVRLSFAALRRVKRSQTCSVRGSAGAVTPQAQQETHSWQPRFSPSTEPTHAVDKAQWSRGGTEIARPPAAARARALGLASSAVQTTPPLAATRNCRRTPPAVSVILPFRRAGAPPRASWLPRARALVPEALPCVPHLREDLLLLRPGVVGRGVVG